MYDTLKKSDRLKDKWNRKVQILSKKQHSVKKKKKKKKKKNIL